ncbi:MAG: peptidase MA family metallohydrolase [Chloroflexota bacterium]
MSSLSRSKFWLLFAFLALSLWGAPSTVQAQETPFQAESDVSYTFGQVMHFSLRAKSSDPITQATLFFNTPEMESTFSVEFDVEPAKEVSLTHDVSLTQVRLAPFTTVRYWWRLTTDGGPVTVEEQVLDYVDDRYEWHELTENDVTVRWTGEELGLGQTALDVLQEARPQLEAILPQTVAPVRVYIYPGMADLRSALRLTGRDWVGADAMPELDVVLVTAVNPRTAAFDLGQSIPHELSHLLLYRAAGANYDGVPRWFDEGLATLMEFAPNQTYDVVLEQAIAAGGTRPLASLCAAFPAGEAQAQLAYAQSASVVEYIRREYGDGALRRMIAAFADGADCDSGVRRVLGISLAELESEWLEREQPLSPLGRVWQEYGLWILLLGGGFGVTSLLLLPVRKER